MRNLLRIEKSGGSVKTCAVVDYAEDVSILQHKLKELSVSIDTLGDDCAENLLSKLRARLHHLAERSGRLEIEDDKTRKKTQDTFFNAISKLNALVCEKIRSDPPLEDEFSIKLALASSPQCSRTRDRPDVNISSGESSDEESLPLRTFPRRPGNLTLRPRDVQTWNVRFTGEDNNSVNSFIERVEELCAAYHGNQDSLLDVALFLFEG